MLQKPLGYAINKFGRFYRVREKIVIFTKIKNYITWATDLKGTATLMVSMFYQKELYEPWILIQVSSKSVEKWASYGHLKNLIWPTFSRHNI